MKPQLKITLFHFRFSEMHCVQKRASKAHDASTKAIVIVQQTKVNKSRLKVLNNKCQVLHYRFPNRETNKQIQVKQYKNNINHQWSVFSPVQSAVVIYYVKINEKQKQEIKSFISPAQFKNTAVAYLVKAILSCSVKANGSIHTYYVFFKPYKSSTA